jgi:Fe-S cluster assembly protein SufD
MIVRRDIGWLDELREAGRVAFRAHGLPTVRSESWKYTSLKPLDDFAFARPERSAGVAATDPALLALAGPRLVFVNGIFEAELSQDAGPAVPLSLALDNAPDKVRKHLGKVATAEEPLTALNAGFIDDGVALWAEPTTSPSSWSMWPPQPRTALPRIPAALSCWRRVRAPR